MAGSTGFPDPWTSSTTTTTTTTAGATAARRLRDALLRREIAPGERLATERALAEQWGIDRGTVRAGLQRLVAQGLLVQRQGRGTTARDFVEVGGLELIEPLLRTSTAKQFVEHVDALLLVRRHLAAAVLEALVRAPPDENARRTIADRVDDFAALVTRRATGEEVEDTELARADVAVLAAIVDATGRTVLRLALNPVAALFADFPALQAAVVADAHDSVTAYRALCAWLVTPDESRISLLLSALAARDAATLVRLAAAPHSQKNPPSPVWTTSLQPPSVSANPQTTTTTANGKKKRSAGREGVQHAPSRPWTATNHAKKRHTATQAKPDFRPRRKR